MRLDGNHKLYLRLLLMFRANYIGIGQEIRTALIQGERELTRRLVHTLEGVAANISPTGLSAAAKIMGADLAEENHARLEEHLGRVEQRPEIVLASIAKRKQSTKPASHSPEKTGNISLPLKQLAHLLTHSAAEAVNYTSSLV
jgi:HPt (histidine-containing phosphotransfer) domain-containing protein